MSASLPDWLAPPPESYLPVWSPPAPRVELGNRALPLPDWLSGSPRDKASGATKALLFQQYEMVTPRVFELVCAGYTLSNAIKEISFPIDQGAYMTWLKRQPEMYAMFKEAKEVRTEVWAGEIIRHATAEETEEGKPYLHDTSRSRLIVDTYKWLMGADNRKQYGDTKTVDITNTISIRGALEAAQGRVERIIEAEVIEEEREVGAFKQLPEPTDWEDEDV